MDDISTPRDQDLISSSVGPRGVCVPFLNLPGRNTTVGRRGVARVRARVCVFVFVCGVVCAGQGKEVGRSINVNRVSRTRR